MVSPIFIQRQAGLCGEESILSCRKLFFAFLFPIVLFHSVVKGQDTTTVYSVVEEIIITASPMREEYLVGPNRQPEWTTRRRFPSTRVYVQTLPGQMKFEQWLELRVPRKSSKLTEMRMRTEFAFGLDDRVQLDLYLHSRHLRSGESSLFEWRGWSAELRWALAQWGKIPGNPTLYLEYLFFNGAPDKIEPKLLLGGELGFRWHWGVNLIHERELAAEYDQDVEWAVSGAVSYTLIDQKLSLGPALNFSSETERILGDSETTNEFLLGFTLQLRPQRKGFLDIEPLFGVTEDSKRMKVFIVFGWDL
jgi:hypothetical protein